MAASMESSGQTRAATLMNAARRSHFVSRIEKYEAKVRQAKALMKEQKEASTMGERRRSITNTEGLHFTLQKEVNEGAPTVDQRRPILNAEEQQRFLLERRTVPMPPTEKSLVPAHTLIGIEQKAYRHFDKEPPHEPHEQDLSLKKTNSREYSPLEQVFLQHEQGFLSQDEGFHQQGGVSSPEQKVRAEQKEIISGVLQRSSSSNMRTIVKGFDTLDMVAGNTAVMDKGYPNGIVPVPSDAHANIYIDFKPPPTADVNIAIIAGALKIRIKAADMSAPMQEHAFRCARDCLDAVGKLQSKRIAYTLKKEFDKVYGPAWHCIVGTSFGSYVTHSLGGFVYFSLEKVSVLLFKTTVEPIENS